MESIKYIKLWAKLMNTARYTGCHQLPERSFFIRGYQFPVCARCAGAFVGEIASYILIAFKFFISPLWTIVLLFIMGLDWLIQFLNIKQSTNVRRFFTGICGGAGITFLYANIILFALQKIKAK